MAVPAMLPRQAAVVDCGTSSVRAYIAEIRGDDQLIIEDLSYPIDLTTGFTAEKLDRESMDGVIEAFAAIAKTATEYGVAQLRSVATSALREASNSDVLVELLRSRVGVDLEIIDSAEEARLYFEALRVVLAKTGTTLDGTNLMIDLGGGSSSLSLIRGGKLVHSVDEHFGTVRLCEQFKDLRDSDDFAITVDRYSLGAAKMMLSRMPDAKPERLVVTGGEIRRLLSLLQPRLKGKLIAPLPAAKVEDWCARMQPLTPLQRGEACKTDAQHAMLMMPAGCLVRHLCALTGIDTVLVPQMTLRDGLLADLLPGAHGPHHLDKDHLIAEAQQLVRRYGGNLEYAENTANLAVQIFDQTRPLHGLDDRHRTLLEFSALVHDIGSYINVRNRHKHTMYVIQSADIAGLSKGEKEMVAHVARYHRRSPPQSHHTAFQSLPRRNRVVVAHLAAILRLAYALDVERSQRIRKLRCEVARNRLLIHVDRRQIALERWSLAGKSQMFDEVFGLKAQVVPLEEA
ncbi:MAG: HD domain-containing protein [Planctomycetes bacterium]|nr:HD domain-containing protein [Planctomycetota bacterium]